MILVKRFLSIYLLMLTGAFAGMMGFSWLEYHRLLTLSTWDSVNACLLMPWVVAAIGPLFIGGAIAMRYLPDGLGGGGWLQVSLAVLFVMSYAPLCYLARKFLGNDTVWARLFSAALLLVYTSFCTYGILSIGAGV